MDLKVICLEEPAFYALIDQVVARIKEKQATFESKWITGDDAMERLAVKSKTTLQKLRDEGKIRFSQPQKKLILYDVNSINDYLEKNAQEPF